MYTFKVEFNLEVNSILKFHRRSWVETSDIALTGRYLFRHVWLKSRTMCFIQNDSVVEMLIAFVALASKLGN